MKRNQVTMQIKHVAELLWEGIEKGKQAVAWYGDNHSKLQR
jgi:hypothetical protein